MRINSPFELVEGVLSAWKVFPDGSRVEVFTFKNLIVKQAKLKLLSSLWDSSIAPDPIQVFKVGTGGALDPEGRFPKPENPLQGDLYSPQISVQCSYVVYPDEVKVTYLADLDKGEGNGMLLTEAGLFKQSGSIFNVKNFPAIPKTAEFGLHFEWTVKAL